MPILEDHWRHFAHIVITPEAGPVVHKHMRRAFYAGVRITIGEVSKLESIYSDRSQQTLDAIKAELKAVILQISNDED